MELDGEELLRQIDDFEKMGIGGFHIHSRVGLDTEYLGDEFMDLVEKCVAKADDRKLMACLYDEDRWPSGCAGGLVVAEKPEYKLQHLLLTARPYGNLGEKPAPSASGRAVRSEEGFLLARYNLQLNPNGTLSEDSRLLGPSEPSGDDTWYAYVEPNPLSEWFNSQTYVDTFSKPAIARFIEITHEKYKSKVGEQFGKVIPSIFTDEPQFAHKTQLQDARQKQDVFMPWTLDLLETFKRRYDSDLLTDLLEIVWNRPLKSGPSLARYRFHDHICDRFSQAFMDQISAWCQKNGIFLIGHLMKEPFLWSQTDAVGEAMRCYRNLNVPGVDILCDRFEFNTVKQAASVARQNGGKGVMSELYGVTNWTFDFEGHKGSGDWQAALGVTFRVPHLTWASMAGEAKRYYPSSIGYQSPWFEEYSFIENYFARLNVVLTRGQPVTRIGVIHPIESYWLCRGPVQESFEEQNFRKRAFSDLTEWLLEELVNFDFISESLLPGQIRDGCRIGACDYEVIIVPNLKTIRRSTLQYLESFARSGGKILVAGEAPKFIDAMIQESDIDIPASSIPFTRSDILQAIANQRDIRISGNGKVSRQFLHQMRQDGECKYVFICNRERKTGRFTAPNVTVSMKGLWKVEILNPFDGQESSIASEVCSGWTNVKHRFDGCSSLLLRLSPGSPNPLLKSPAILAEKFRMDSEVILNRVELDEPNVLLLDYAEYRLNDESWNKAEEVLRIDNIIRSRLGIPLKLEAYKQPWSIPETDRKSLATLELCFRFSSEVEIDAELATEDLGNSGEVLLNGQRLGKEVGWWVDRAIRRFQMPGIQKGENILLVKFPFGLLTSMEWFYVLGSFGVSLKGRKARLIPEQEVLFGDWTRQGLPFYAGNVTYHCTITKAQALWVRFSGPLVAVSVGGSRKGVIAFEPYILELGNRLNAFGHLHLPAGKSPWCGPLLWRTEDDWWTPEYSIVPMGILQTPVAMTIGKPKAAFWKEGPTY